MGKRGPKPKVRSTITATGHVLVRDNPWLAENPSFPFVWKDGRFYEHHRAAWLAGMMGSFDVKRHVVHHVDENKANNDPANLAVMTRAEHRRVHNQKGSEPF